MLYVVPKTPTPAHTESNNSNSIESTNPITPHKQSFLSDLQEQSTNLFSFYAQDARYDLRCSMLFGIQDVLSTEEPGSHQEEFLIPTIVGDFPSIDGEFLLEKAFGNEYIQGILITRFYLNILEALFLFSEQVNANSLTLTFNDHNLDMIEIYRNFIVSEYQVMSDKGEQTQIRISTDVQTYDALIDHMEKINEDFRKTLWRKQWGNSTIREYLKSYALSDF